MDKLRTLNFFVSVSDRGSFVEAAKLFGISPSTISKAIARLEQDLGVQLFTRTTRALNLTSAGRDYLRTVKTLLQELDATETNLRDVSDSISGSLKINVPVSYGRLYIRPLIAGFCRLYPNIDIDLIYDDAYVDIIEKGIDVTFRSGTLVDNRLIARKLSPMDFLICAPKGYFSEGYAIDSPQDLLQHPWVNFRFKQTGKIMPIMLPADNAGDYQEYFSNTACMVDDGEALAELCADGVGLAQMPHFIARNWIRNNTIEAVLPPYSPANFGVFALYTKMDKTPPKVKAFIDYVQQWLASIGEHSQGTWARELNEAKGQVEPATV